MNRHLTDSDLDSYASAFARKGGHARAQKLSAEQLSAIGRKAINTRWAGHTPKPAKPRKRKTAKKLNV